MTERILIIEDDRKLAPLVQRYLEDHGYTVDWVADGDQGARAVERWAPDLVLLDLMLPGRDGLTLCREIRQAGETAILILTAKGDETDRVIGLELGADDYLPKPFGLPELLARVRAVLRRCRQPAASTEPTRRPIGPYRLDLDRRSVDRDGKAIHLTRSEFDILDLLTRHPGRVFSRDALLDRVRGGATEAYDRAVDTHISNLRGKLEADPKSPRYLKTVWGVGYRWDEDRERDG